MTDNTITPETNTPDPGTDAAYEAGCICPWLDNKDRQPDGPFVYVSDCPVHPVPEMPELAYAADAAPLVATAETKAHYQDQMREVLQRWANEYPGVLSYHQDTVSWHVRYTPCGGHQQHVEITRLYWADMSFSLTAEAIDRLTLVAVAEQYRPWLQLAASLPYTGAKAAQLALQVMGEESPLATTLEQVQKDLGDRMQTGGGGE